MNLHRFQSDGYIVMPRFLDDASHADLEIAFTNIQKSHVDLRSLLELSCCRDLANKIRLAPEVHALLPADAVAVQCTYFEKSKDQNWLVPVHQDLSIPVQAKIDHPELRGWSDKDGTVYVQPPDRILDEMVAVRFHIDECGMEDGPLKVVPGSHRLGRLTNDQVLNERDLTGETACAVARGGIMVMKPLLLHASSKASGQNRRRVLHFVFGPRNLPFGLQWKYAV